MFSKISVRKRLEILLGEFKFNKLLLFNNNNNNNNNLLNLNSPNKKFFS